MGSRPPQVALTLAQLLGFLGSLFFLGQALMAMLVYVWSRRSPQVRVNFFGLLNFQAPFLPWALMGFSMLLGNSVLTDLLGEPAHPSHSLKSAAPIHTSPDLSLVHLPISSSCPNSCSVLNAPQTVQLAHRICICG